MVSVTRPEIEWISDTPPPASTKVVSLTKYGVMNLGPVTKYEWDSGFVICWQHCMKKPANWHELLETRR